MLQLAPSTVSKHVTILQQAGLIESRKDGRWRYYRLAGKNAPPVVKTVLRWLLDALADDPRTATDDQQLKQVMKKDVQKLCELYRS